MPCPVFCSVLWLCNWTFGTVNHTNSLSGLSDDGGAGFDDDFDKMVDSSVRIAPLALSLTPNSVHLHPCFYMTESIQISGVAYCSHT